MKYFFSNNRFGHKILLIFACTIFCISCQTDETALQNDATAKVTINNTNQILNSGQKLKAEDFEALKAVYEKYPNSETALQTYKSTLITRSDWASLEKLLKEIPAANLSEEDKINLGKTYIKLGRYRDAIETLKPLESMNNLEIKTILANAYFQLADYEQAKPLFDSNWEMIIKEKRANDVAMRGMIYFYEKETEKAIEALEKALELDSSNITAANGLSRIYAAKGETEKAEEYLARVQQSFDIMTADETRKTKIVSQFYKLQEAYKAKRFQEVINVSKELLPEADTRNKAALMQYLFNSYQALGMQKEAQEIMAQAKQMQQKQ